MGREADRKHLHEDALGKHESHRTTQSQGGPGEKVEHWVPDHHDVLSVWVPQPSGAACS